MKLCFASIATLCLISLIACGEPETAVDDDVALVESETVITETATPEAVVTEGEGTTAIVTDPDTPVSSEPTSSEVATTPAPSRTPAQTPAATSPARQPDAVPEPPARTEPRAEPKPEPKPETAAPVTPPAPAPTEAAPAASSKLPKTHTVDREGAMHAPGSEDPNKRCAACHGKDLQGGRAGVSCFDCHEKVWE